jgi:phospho-N-acetylmuramoyl-pentapeptide-transferase
MLYYLFDWLKREFNMAGAGLFQYITFRAMAALILSLIISMLIGRRIINFIRKKQIGETIRDLGLQGEQSKRGTPTMGGIIILLAILVPTLLLTRLLNVYVLLMIVVTVWLGAIGFIDDYIKVFKKNKEGLAGRFKIVGQVGIGLIVGLTLLLNKNVVVLRELNVDNPTQVLLGVHEKVNPDSIRVIDGKKFALVKSPITTIPFVKSHEFNYAKLLPKALQDTTATDILYVLIVIFIITAVSNGANITDGLDGLAGGTSAIIGGCLGIFAYVSGNYKLAEYLNITFIPNLGELSVFICAFIGACIGFLWYNAFPAQVFMGDTGSLALGGIIGALAIIVRKELLIPIFCGVFFVELLSVTLQVAYFKYTKKKYGEGRRIFLMSPLHHHYQKLGFHESKIATRFWIVTVGMVALSIITLKMR